MIRGDKIREFKSSTKPSNPNMIKELLAGINNAIPLLKGIEIVYTGFGGGIFLLPSKSMKLTRPEKSKWLENPISSKKNDLVRAPNFTKKNQAHQCSQGITMKMFHLKLKYQREGSNYKLLSKWFEDYL